MPYGSRRTKLCDFLRKGDSMSSRIEVIVTLHLSERQSGPLVAAADIVMVPGGRGASGVPVAAVGSVVQSLIDEMQARAELTSRPPAALGASTMPHGLGRDTPGETTGERINRYGE